MAKSPKPAFVRLSVTQTFDNNPSLSGSIEANERVEIRSEVSGIVKQLKKAVMLVKDNCFFKVNDTELMGTVESSQY
jgi:membrane fusion protein (multidrug efflux system)